MKSTPYTCVTLFSSSSSFLSSSLSSSSSSSFLWPPDEGPPCTCPLCASDWSSCVPHSEGLQLSRDLGATYLELPSLNHVFVGRYFGSVVGAALILGLLVMPKHTGRSPILCQHYDLVKISKGTYYTTRCGCDK